MTVFVREAIRRGWVVILCVAVATIVAAVAGSGTGDRYRASATLFVPASRAVEGGTVDVPGRATEAQKLAASYAGIITDDTGIAQAVGGAVGLSPGEARGLINTTNRSNTAVIDVEVTADTADRAVAGLRALVSGITAPVPVSPAITPGTLVAARQVEEATRTGDLPPALTGAVLGLMLGIVAAIALARADRRADHSDDLAALVQCPVTEVSEADDHASTAELAAIVQRWDRVLPGDDLVLLPVGRSAEGDAWRVLHRLSAAARMAGVPLTTTVEADAPLRADTGGDGPRPARDKRDRPERPSERAGRDDTIDLSGAAPAAPASPSLFSRAGEDGVPVTRPPGTPATRPAAGVRLREVVHPASLPVDGPATGRSGNGGGGRSVVTEIDRTLHLTAAPPPPVGLPTAMQAGHVVLIARQSDRISAIGQAQADLADFGLFPSWVLLVQR
jgi:capsular polysaccharide biosynthesis protein